MLKRKSVRSTVFGLLILLLANGVLFAKSYFLYDFNDNKILFLGEDETTFTEKIVMDKKPDYIMPTVDPDRYLAIFTPDEKQDRAGSLVIFNIKSGRTEDLVELGYYPYRWEHSADYRLFYISYCADQKTGSFELLKYDTSELRTSKLPRFIQRPKAMTLSDNNRFLYLIENSNDQATAQVLKVAADTLEIKATLPVGPYPDRLYVLSDDRIAVLNRDLRTKEQLGPEQRINGSIKLIDTLNNSIVEERKLKATDVYATWDNDHKALIVSVDYSYFLGTLGLKGKGEFIKVTRQGMSYHLIKGGWIDLDYLPRLDRLYVLNGKTAQVINYRNNTVSEIKTGNNLIANGAGAFYICRLQSMADSNYEIIYCYSNGDVRFIDLTDNKMVKKVKCGRSGKRFLQAILAEGKAKAALTTNADKSVYYVLNTATKDITVLNQKFDVVTYIVPDDQPLGMYQVKKAGYQTIAATEKMVYRIANDNTLTPIYEFTEKPKFSDFLEDKGRVILWTDREIVVLDAASLEVKNQFCWNVKKDEIGVKLPKGAQRYWFLDTL